MKKSAPAALPGPPRSLARAAAEMAQGGSQLALADLVPDPQNRRTHTARNLEMVAAALQEVGAARSIVVDEANTVLAGNGVVEAAGVAGITQVRIVETDGTELIAVRRRGLSEEQKRALAIYDNRTAELAEWNWEQLQADVAAGLDLAPWFSSAELKSAIGSSAATPRGGTDQDDHPAMRATSIVVGDIFTLGRHVLACGDCRDTTLAGRLCPTGCRC